MTCVWSYAAQIQLIHGLEKKARLPGPFSQPGALALLVPLFAGFLLIAVLLTRLTLLVALLAGLTLLLTGLLTGLRLVLVLLLLVFLALRIVLVVLVRHVVLQCG